MEYLRFNSSLNIIIEKEYVNYSNNIKYIDYCKIRNSMLRNKLGYSHLNFSDLNDLIINLHQISDLIKRQICYLNSRAELCNENKLQLLINKFSDLNSNLETELDYLNNDNFRLETELSKIKRVRL